MKTCKGKESVTRPLFYLKGMVCADVVSWVEMDLGFSLIIEADGFCLFTDFAVIFVQTRRVRRCSSILSTPLTSSFLSCFMVDNLEFLCCCFLGRPG